MFAILRALWTIPLVLLLAACNGSATDSVPDTKLTSEEQGVLETLRPLLGYLVTKEREAAQSAAQAAQARSVGKLADAETLEGKRRAALAHVATGVVKWAERANGGPVLEVPDSLADLRHALRGVWNLRHQLAVSHKSGRFDTADLSAIEQNLVAVRDADALTAKQLRARAPSSEGRNIKTSTLVELAGVPLALDITSGEVKVKWSHGVGPIKWTVAAGPGSREGIKTLILRSGNSQRVYAVAGRTILLHIPASTLQTDGSRMIITTL